MAKISVKIEDDNGNLLQAQAYELGDKLDNIDLIESSVEKLRSQLLPQVSKQLLIAGQEAYKKKQPKKQR
jgi:hypothetical protein